MGRCSRARSLFGRSARLCVPAAHSHFSLAAPMESLDREYTVFCTAWDPLVHTVVGAAVGAGDGASVASHACRSSACKSDVS